MKAFIVSTTNFAASCLACKATKTLSDEVGTALHKKAAIATKTGKMILTSIDEMTAWVKALEEYKSENDAEKKIKKALINAATHGIANRSEAAVAKATA